MSFTQAQHSNYTLIMAKVELTYLIDDDAIVLLLGRKVFARHDKFGELQTFENGGSALDTITAQAGTGTGLPSLILLDLNMPGMDGWEFLEQFKRIPETAHIPVVILTSSIDPQDIAKSKTFDNVKDYIPKPLTTEKLDQILASAKPND